MSSSASPVALFAFDAAELALIREGIDNGSLPTLRTLLESGCFVRLDPMPSKAYNTAWTSVDTGTDLGDHQVVLHQHLEPGTYRLVDVPSNAARQPPFWRYLSDAGISSSIASVYGASLLDSFNGAQVLGWGTADPHWGKFGKVALEPPEVRKLIRKAVGRRHALSYVVKTPRTERDYRRYRDRMLRSVDDQERTLRVLLTKTKWQFFFGSFGEPHQAGHLLWHLDDPSHPLHDPDASEDVRGALRAIYTAVDSALGRLIAELPPGCRTFVVTPHGMGPNFVDEPADTVLTLGGFARHATVLERGAGRRELVLRAVWSVARRLIPTRLRLAARTRLPRDRLLGGMALADMNWSETRAFALPSDLTSSIRVNLAGREPAGVVQPGAEYEQLLDELSDAFRALEFADSGLPAVDDVIRCNALFGRPVDGPLPDILVIWANTGKQIRRLRSPQLGTFAVPFGDPRTGQHRQAGFIIGSGPGIPPSSSSRLEGSTAGLLDVAPTMLALLDVERPQALAGQPIADFCGPPPVTSSGAAGPGREHEQAEQR